MKINCNGCHSVNEEPLLIGYQDTIFSYCCFECAINQLAPECARCESKILGQSFYKTEDAVFCDHRCAQRLAVCC